MAAATTGSANRARTPRRLPAGQPADPIQQRGIVRDAHRWPEHPRVPCGFRSAVARSKPYTASSSAHSGLGSSGRRRPRASTSRTRRTERAG